MEKGIHRRSARGLGLCAMLAVCAIIGLTAPPGVLAADRVVLCEEFTNLY